MPPTQKSSDYDGSDASNDRLREMICQEMGLSGRLGLRGVSVHVDNDRIVLSGTVPSYFLKQIAQEAARRACRHRRVLNELAVSDPT